MKYLALGDSYTIGEQVAASDNFPNQVKALLQQSPKPIEEVTIIATTAWKTYDLVRAMENSLSNEDQFDFVSLLIGVNNQYNNRPLQEFKNHFTYLLDRALHFAGNRPHRVVVLSIPDWGLTPFNTNKDKAVVSRAIDDYNKIVQEVSTAYACHYIPITKSTRENALKPEYLAPDQLHPSKLEYAIWAKLVAQKFRENSFTAVLR